MKSLFMQLLGFLILEHKSSVQYDFWHIHLFKDPYSGQETLL